MTWTVVSEVQQSPTIAAVVVESSAPGAWQVEPGSGLLVSRGTVSVRLAEVLKGRIDDKPGEVVDVAVAVRRSQQSRPSDRQGMWSQVPVDEGARLVAFADAGTRGLGALLTDAHLLQLTTSGPVIGDVRTAVAWQRRHLTVDRVLALADDAAATTGAVLARWVWVATRAATAGSPERFARLMAVAEDLRTRIDGQEAYLTSAYEDLTFSEAFGPQQRARLVQALTRTALDPRVGELRATVIGVWLPNLVRSAVPEPIGPDEAFSPGGGSASGGQDPAALRDALRAELADPRDPVTTSATLLAWLDGDVTRAGTDGRG